MECGGLVADTFGRVVRVVTDAALVVPTAGIVDKWVGTDDELVKGDVLEVVDGCAPENLMHQ